MTNRLKVSSLLLCSLVALCAPACKRRAARSLAPLDEIDRRKDVPMTQPAVERDLAQVRERGTLTVLAPYNSTTYFVYRGEPLGYEYELLRAFASDHNLALKMIVVTDPKSLLPLLNSGEGDIAAARLIPTPDDEQNVSFTSALYRTEPALVQQESPPASAGKGAQQALKPGPADELPEVDIKARLVTRPEQLAGQTVNLPQKSAYKRTLVELADEVSGDIRVVEADGRVQDEALAQKVARGEVEFTVMQDNLAALKEAEFSNLKVRPIVGRRHPVSWAVRKNSPELLRELNDWIEDRQRKNNSLFDRLYKKYFVDQRAYVEHAASDYLTSATGKLSEYDDLLKRHASEIDWDWRLLASQVCQESRFKPDARSWAGATGLLQLMPPTARQFGVKNPLDPEDNVQGAVKFLKWLRDYWTERIPDAAERLKFILASYNTGAGHVEDAQRLTEKYGGDPLKWDDVSYWLLQKSSQQYSTDPVVKFGFCRGIEPVNYVTHILERYDHYKQYVAAARPPATKPRASSHVGMSRPGLTSRLN
ncbi:MAG TPA: transporter substrate-binding domain-containing protein [Pyrinomonadaceae bacterium]|jgi:membrane-bound lytic murein transglycosylase F|nr:transporter substrate-binding domain-containing protein [Pyrinomonadaceae bacterium]